MNVLLFINEANGAIAGRLLNVVARVVPSRHLEILRNTQELSKRLIKLPKQISIGVLLAQSRDQLMELVALRSVFEGIRTIVVIPDNENVTIALGHLLRPTLLTCAGADPDFADVAAVLTKCLG